MAYIIFISSVQREFTKERRALAEYIRKDAILGKFFEVFLFEEVPAQERKAEGVYLSEVDECDIYLGIFGHTYGNVDSSGISATEREYLRAAKRHKTRICFIDKSAGDTDPRQARSFPASMKMSFARASSATMTCVLLFTHRSPSIWRTKASSTSFHSMRQRRRA